MSTTSRTPKSIYLSRSEPKQHLLLIGIVRWSPVFSGGSEAFSRALDRSKDVGAPVTQLSDHYGVVSMVSGSGVDQGLWPMICQLDSGHQLQYCWSLKWLCLCHVTLCYFDNGMILFLSHCYVNKFCEHVMLNATSLCQSMSHVFFCRDMPKQ